jgi:acyl-CoA thioesterase
VLLLTTDRPAHSLHAYFLYGGDINAPIIYEVDRLRDGKALSAVKFGQFSMDELFSRQWCLLLTLKKA